MTTKEVAIIISGMILKCEEVLGHEIDSDRSSGS